MLQILLKFLPVILHEGFDIVKQLIRNRQEKRILELREKNKSNE